MGCLATTTTTTTTTTNLPSQCLTYSPINDPTRLATATGNVFSDAAAFTAGYTWHRFIGAGGDDIVTTAPPGYRCGGYYSGWFVGVPPTYGTTVSGTVCYSYSTVCQLSNTILMTNWGTYNVYALTNTPTTYARYCTA